MRHLIDGRKFGRNTSNRVAMFRNMANSVIEKEQITTTVQKAKEVRRVVDRLITLAKEGSPSSRRLVFNRTRNDLVVTKLFNTLAERYRSRPGGYTRVLKLSDRRWGDAAEMAVIELVDHPEISRKRKPKASESEGGAENEQNLQEDAPKDSFKKFRKLFSPKSKVKGGQHGSMAGLHKGAAGAGRKTPASGGGNKSGGAS